MPIDQTPPAIQNIRALMTAHKITAADIGRQMDRGEDGQWVRAVLAGRNAKGLREVSDYLRKTYDMPSTWPELVQAHGIPLAPVPHAGSVAAGKGLSGSPDFDPVMVPQSWITPLSTGLTVKGDSMFPVLRDGDSLLVEPASRPIDGWMMVFRTSEGMVVKTPRQTLAGWVLESANPTYPPVPAADLEAVAVGIVSGIFRQIKETGDEMARRRTGGFQTESLLRAQNLDQLF